VARETLTQFCLFLDQSAQGFVPAQIDIIKIDGGDLLVIFLDPIWGIVLSKDTFAKTA
jgi:hypothetical protein